MHEVKWKLLSGVWLFVNPQTIQFMEFSRPKYWSGQPFPSPGDLPYPGIEPRTPALQADSLPAELLGKLHFQAWSSAKLLLKVRNFGCTFCTRNGLDSDRPTLLWGPSCLLAFKEGFQNSRLGKQCTISAFSPAARIPRSCWQGSFFPPTERSGLGIAAELPWQLCSRAQEMLPTIIFWGWGFCCHHRHISYCASNEKALHQMISVKA